MHHVQHDTLNSELRVRRPVGGSEHAKLFDELKGGVYIFLVIACYYIGCSISCGMLLCFALHHTITDSGAGNPKTSLARDSNAALPSRHT